MKNLYIALLASTIMLNSCQKLTQTPDTLIASSAVYTTTSSLQQGVTGLYAALGAKEYYGGYFLMFADLNSDIGTAGGYQNTPLLEFSDHQVSASNVFLQNMWIAMYLPIASANNLLAAMPAVRATATATDQALIDSLIKGQVLAVRALAHFDLLRAFGYHWDKTSSYGIPVDTSVQSYNSVLARSSVADTYAAILKDLLTAKGLLSNTADRSTYLMNYAVVNALLARVYLYMGDVTNAANYASAVIADPTYGMLDVYNYKLQYKSSISSEAIFQLAFTQQSPSYYYATTYARASANLNEILFALPNTFVSGFFASRTGDDRINLTDTSAGYGRTLKYVGGATNKDNPAFIFRLPEMYLIRAEANGVSGLSDLNVVRTNRGLPAITATPSLAEYTQYILDENKAEFNFEGHRFFDLARTLNFYNYLQIGSSSTDQTYAAWPIPSKEINASAGVIVQNPNY